jgi:hypothetical protein
MRVGGQLLLVDGRLIQNGRVSAVRSVAKQFIQTPGPQAWMRAIRLLEIC